LYAGTLSRGAWERSLTDYVTSVELSSDKALNNFQLAQNYPNPFNPATTIQYSIPQRSNVVIKVYDILGNEAANLVNEEKGEGVYSITFNAVGLANGIYFYTLRAGSYVQTKKMLLVK